MDAIYVVLIAVGAVAVGLGLGFVLRMKLAEKKIGSAQLQAKQILEDDMHTAESKY